MGGFWRLRVDGRDGRTGDNGFAQSESRHPNGSTKLSVGVNMATWADYGASAVRYNAAYKHIDRVRIHRTTATKEGITLITFFNANSQWQKGQPVYIIRVDGIEHIKTVNNG